MFDRAKLAAQLVRAARSFGGTSRRRRLPAQQPPLLVERAYAQAIAEYMRPRVAAAFAPLMRELPAILERAAAERRLDQEPGWTSRAVARMDAWFRRDAGEGRRLRELIETARETLRSSISTDDIERLAEKFAQQTSTHQRVQLARQTKAALGVDVVGSDRKLRPVVENYVANNVSLIKGISDKLAQKTERLVIEAVTTGELAGDLAEKFQKIGYGDREAALIARDQIGKLNGQLNAVRQRELGVDEFIWRNVGDERVRDLHVELDGKIFKYSEGGHPQEGLPGEPVLCRCYPEPVFDPVLAELLADEGADVPADVAPPPPPPPPPPPREPSASERSAVDVYTGGEYRAINAYLRGTSYYGAPIAGDYELSSGRTIKQIVRALDRAIANAPPLPEPRAVFRGVAGRSYRVGEVVDDPAFQSTTRDRVVAEGFARSADGPGTVIELVIPKGTRALDATKIMGGAEGEYLLPRGTRLRIVSVKGGVARAEIVPRPKRRK